MKGNKSTSDADPKLKVLNTGTASLVRTKTTLMKNLWIIFDIFIQHWAKFEPTWAKLLRDSANFHRCMWTNIEK